MNERELRRLIGVANLYYKENKTQAQIAEIMEISRPSVSNLLARARREEVVKIEIVDFDETPIGISYRLRERFNLKSCSIVPAQDDKAAMQAQIFDETLTLILGLLPKVRIFGLGWGYNIAQLLDRLEQLPVGEGYSGQVCPLIGTATVPHRGYHPNEMAVDFGQKTGLTPAFLMAPAFPESRAEAELFMTTENYKAVAALWRRLDTAVVTLGAYPNVPDQATASRFGRELTDRKAVSNILSYFYNVAGEQIQGEDDHAIQIPTGSLGRIRNLIGLTPVGSNPDAVLGCLRAGCIKHLIIDEALAKLVANAPAIEEA